MKFIGKGPALLKLKGIKNIEIPELILISYKEYLKNKNSFSKKINFWASMKRTNKFIRINTTTNIRKGISKLINEN